MKKLFFLILSTLCLFSCGTEKKTTTVHYSIAQGYFVRNDAPPHASSYYDTQESFDSVFGYATVMGEDGAPTTIDFQHQNVIALIGTTTICPTDFTPISLTSLNDTLLLKYKSIEQSPTTYSMKPLLLLVIDKPSNKPTVKIEKQ